jgi:hypothetical protein
MVAALIVVLWGFVAQAQAPAGQTVPARPSNVKLYVETRGARWDNPQGAQQLRLTLRDTFIVVSDRADADIEVRVTFFRAPYSSWRPHPYWPRPYEIGATLMGHGFVSMGKVGGSSWQACAHDLSQTIRQLLPPPSGPRADNRLAV